MSKGREVVFTRALGDAERRAVQPFSPQEVQAEGQAFHALKTCDEEEQSNPPALENSIKMTAEQRQQQAYREAYDKGFAKGELEGVQQALAEQRQQTAEQARQLQSILDRFTVPLKELDDQILDELVAMVTTLAKHFVRRELKHDPGQIIAVTREALAVLPMNSRQIRLYLHPDDATLVREALAVSGEDSPWRIVEDGSLSRGGLKVVSENSQIDATVESRFAEVVARIIGDERDSEGG